MKETIEKRLEKVEVEINNIKARNKKVELDKKWETSNARKIIIAVMTYIIILIFFIVAELPNPFMNALVPTTAFVLSTLTLGFIKNYWIERLT